jgi:hypothetical protein
MKRIILVGLAVLVLLTALGATLIVAAGAELVPLDDPLPATTISLSPVERHLTPSAYTTITIDIENFENLLAVQVHLTFDPQVVIVDDAQETTPKIEILPGDLFSPPYVVGNEANNKTGVITYSAMIDVVQPGAPHSISGSGTLATITFQGLGLGASDIAIRDVALLPPSATSGETMDVDILHGCRISVTPPLNNKTYLPLGLRNAP